MSQLEELKSIIEDQFLDIVTDILEPSPDKLRLMLEDQSFIDIRLSQKIKNRFDFHWERRHLDKTIYRYDNFPDTNFKDLKTFPFHFHKKQETNVVESPFDKKIPQGFIDFMDFIRTTLNKIKSSL